MRRLAEDVSHERSLLNWEQKLLYYFPLRLVSDEATKFYICNENYPNHNVVITIKIEKEDVSVC